MPQDANSLRDYGDKISQGATDGKHVDLIHYASQVFAMSQLCNMVTSFAILSDLYYQIFQTKYK